MRKIRGVTKKDVTNILSGAITIYLRSFDSTVRVAHLVLRSPCKQGSLELFSPFRKEIEYRKQSEISQISADKLVYRISTEIN